MNYILECYDSTITPIDKPRYISSIGIYPSSGENWERAISISIEYALHPNQVRSTQLDLDKETTFKVAIGLLTNLFPKPSEHDLAQIFVAITDATEDIAL